ncbi:MAG: hypothetical protein ALECFALPRED_001140 [Alectoria fallacina]|uniref:Oxidoreductase FAD/NAD(P)-binding domain-containing protein n=1 Tax=Alectoria fallacina TaxID=1903189 RepID=A0A8H3FB25_9LECA|nr:MAG: hypothetical protein ALECFALPRED_001140 [Alectoria fallacina]
MICAGTGVASFRAFVQQRTEQISARRAVATALLILGYRHLEKATLYLAEFGQLEAQGAVQVKRAASKSLDESKGCRDVQYLL